MIDWDAGRYELTAAELLPVARHVVELAEVRPGRTVVDLACGTGNAALLAAAGGAQVTGLDSAPRLIEVARGRAAEGGVPATFVLGDLQALPFEDGAYDIALSVFGLIFAPDPQAALAELVRVLRPGGSAFVSVWVPAGPIDAMIGVFAAAMPPPPRPLPKRFPWHDPDAVAELAAPHALEVKIHEGMLTIEDASPEAYLEKQGTTHPGSLAMRPALERAGTLDAARERALQVLQEANADPAGFRVRSPYRVIALRRPA